MEVRDAYVVKESKTSTVTRRIPLTAWINVKENPPKHVGWYNTKGIEGLEHGDRHYWEDGEYWEYGNFAGVLRVRRAVAVSEYQGLSEKCPK